MTPEEAKKVAWVIAKADSGCPVCVGVLEERAEEAFPEFDWHEIMEEIEADEARIFYERTKPNG